MDPIQKTELGTKQKALAINLDPRIYGSFAEIGAGQDVAANFFKAEKHHTARLDWSYYWGLMGHGFNG